MDTLKDKDALGDGLLNVPPSAYGAQYNDHVLEIYKLYVEMADRISARRQSANSFFLTINSALVALIGYVNLRESYGVPSFVFYTLVSVAGMLLSYLWYRLILSYKQINAGKFRVVHEIELLLPLRIYYFEWKVLGEGREPHIYKPFTHIEIFVPWVFFALYAFVFLGSFYLICVSL